MEVAETRLPGVRTLPHAPDSLVHVALIDRRGDPTLVVDSTWSLLEARKRWSSGGAFESGPIASSVQSRGSFVTLQSLEASLAGLAEAARDSAAGFGARPMRNTLQKRLKTYRDELQVDYCRFGIAQDIGRLFDERVGERGYEVMLESDTGQQRLAERIKLRWRGEVVRPYKLEHMPFASHHGQPDENDPTRMYRCYEIYFKRSKNGMALLDGATKLTFWPRHSPKKDAYYVWKLPSHSEAAAHPSP